MKKGHPAPGATATPAKRLSCCCLDSCYSSWCLLIGDQLRTLVAGLDLFFNAAISRSFCRLEVLAWMAGCRDDASKGVAFICWANILSDMECARFWRLLFPTSLNLDPSILQAWADELTPVSFPYVLGEVSLSLALLQHPPPRINGWKLPPGPVAPWWGCDMSKRPMSLCCLLRPVSADWHLKVVGISTRISWCSKGLATGSSE